MARLEPPSSLSIKNAITTIDGFGGLAKACRFAVTIVPQSGSLLDSLPYKGRLRELVHLCDATEFPGRGFDITETRYYGPRISTPNNTNYGAGILLSFLCRNDGIERRFFDDWMDIINPINTFNFNFPNQYYCDINIFQFADYKSQTKPGEPALKYAWTIKNAWPTLVQPQTVTWTDNDVLRLQVMFAYKYWERAEI